ncbi:MAG: RNA recognition motif domain-containing protein [Chitinophagales bacterium]
MNIYVGNLDYRITEEDLRDIFEEYGIVESVKLIIDKKTNRSKGYAFVEMQKESDGQKAIEDLEEAELEGRVMRINIGRGIQQNKSNKRHKGDYRSNNNKSNNT